MPEIKNIFTAGKMNKSLDERGIPKNEYRHAENIQVNSTDGADIGAVQNLLGNSVIQNQTNFTSPHFKGGVVDSTSNKIYWFVKDDNGSYMLSFDEVNVSFLIKDIGNTVFNFDNNLITGITLFEDHVVITDNINEPYIIDLNYFTSDKVRFDPVTDNTQILYDGEWLDLATDDITIIKKKPESALNIDFVEKTLETDKALFEDKFVRFAYRWKFENGQYSAFSPFSTVAFNPGAANAYDIEEGYNLQMLNNIVQINISNFEKTNGVEFIDILYKESNNNNVYVYKTIPASDITDSTTEISLTKESIYSIVPSDQLLRQYDNVPQKAKAVENIANRLVFGNYTDGLDLKGYSPSFTISTQNRTENTFQSIKSGRNYQFGVLFEDKYGRQTPVISNDTGSYFRDFNDLGVGKEFAISLNDLPEGTDQIARFKYYVKSTEQEFYNIIVSEAYNDVDAPDDFIWLVIPSYEINKLQEEDFIILKKAANSSVALNNPDLKYKVLDIQSSKPEKLAPNKTFPDKFFVKLKKDSFLTDALLSQQGLAGSSGIIEDTPNNPNWSITTNGMSSNPLMLMWYELYGNRETYYYQDGKIYVDTTQADEQSSETFPEDLELIMPGASCVSGAGEDWRQIKTNISFTDSLGNVVTDVYVRLIEGGTTVLAAEAFAICYENASGEITESNPAIFETIPDNDLLDIYYETEESYPIGEIAQEKTIQWFNCFDLGNGVESNRIRDDFNESTIDKQVRVSTTIAEQFKQRVNKSGLIWSGLFNSRSSVNRLNQFSTGMPITKDLNPEYGSIQLLHTRDTDLITFCEDKVLRILANKDALYNADGSTNVTASNAVFGQAMPYNGEFGISTNPESFAYYGYQAYFTDKARGAVLRLSKDGLTVISSKGMTSYFRDAMIDLNGPILGSYDIHSKQYILSLTGVNQTLGFSESSDGWTSFFTFTPEFGCYLDGKYYTFNKSKIWRHHINHIRNTFYDKTSPSKITFIFNDQPSDVKNFKTLSYEGTSGWIANSIETDLQSGSVTSFKDKEGKWFNNIKGTISTLNAGTLDSKEFSTQGIGYLSTIITPPTPVVPTTPTPVPTVPTPVPTVPSPTPTVPTPVAPTVPPTTPTVPPTTPTVPPTTPTTPTVPPTTPTTPTVPPTTPTVPPTVPSPAPTVCQHVFVPDTQSTTDRGLRFNNNGEQNVPFSNLFGTTTVEGGVSGTVYSVCSSLNPLWLIVSSNVTTEYPSGTYIIGSGGSCTENFDCEWTASPPPTVPTTPPTPPPTVPTPTIWYQLSGCEGQGTRYTTVSASQGARFQADNDGTFLYTGDDFNYLPGSSITGYWTGFYGCPTPPPTVPTTPPPTTPPPTVPSGPTLYYYILQNCANSAQLQYAYSTDPNITNGDTFSYFGNCYVYYDIDPSQQGSINLDPLSSCSCNPPTTPPPVAPPPTPVAPPPTPVAPPPPADNVFTVERADDGYSTYAQLVQGYSVNDLVEMSNDLAGVCYEIMGTEYVVDPSIYGTITGACTPPAPTPVPVAPPPTPTCYAMSLSKNTTSASACSGATRTYYLDTDRLDTANVVYSNSGCSAGVFQSAGYFSDGLQVRYWSGSSFGPVDYCDF